jgi:DNA-binding transcriptional regulator LsrR (DeoR family)
VGEVLGRFVDGQGRVVAAELNDRAVAIKLEDLKGKPVIAIAGGADKPSAIMAVLESRVISGLITDEDTAKAIVDRINAGSKAGETKKSKQNRWRGDSHV